MASTYDLFKRAERIEALAGAIYGALAKQFRDDERTRALFARLEAEEHQHASRIRLLVGTYRNDPKLMEKVNGAEGLEACIAAGEAAFVEVAAGAWGSDLREVKRRLAMLEAQLSKAHVQLLAQNANPALLDFFRQLALQDEAHAELLKP
ncbi:MAG TPA: ferritin family protein [Anaeromyxobacter sp.]